MCVHPPKKTIVREYRIGRDTSRPRDGITPRAQQLDDALLAHEVSGAYHHEINTAAPHQLREPVGHGRVALHEQYTIYVLCGGVAAKLVVEQRVQPIRIPSQPDADGLGHIRRAARHIVLGLIEHLRLLLLGYRIEFFDLPPERLELDLLATAGLFY